VGERVELLRGVGRIGWTSNASEVDPAETRYDLASVTKAMATVPAVLLLVEEGRMGLDEPVARYLPVFSGGGKDAVTIRHLLTHTSGLPAGAILRGEARWQKIDRLLRRIPVNGAPGRRVEYSDVGYVILYEAARRAAGEPLPNYLQRRLWEPLGMTSTGFSPGLDCEECAPTGRLRDGRLYRGRPFDETAQSLDGITGNAGVFSTARDVARFAAMIANGGELDGVRIFRPETVREFARAQPGTGTRTLGWEIFCRGKPVPSNQRCDDPYAFGHTGWTGTSVWIDPERGVWVVLLTNRTYETRAPSRIAEVRRELFDRAMGEAPERGSSPRAR
jgi:CubicO group peptidase (beta-lactamase class C family)